MTVANLQTDYDFNKDLYDFTNQLNDGHTRKSDFFAQST
jgi:hypothetical protein